MFHLDVVYVAIAIHACFKRMFQMFQMFSDLRCKGRSRCCICCYGYSMFQTYVANVLSGCFICCNGYVANVCSKYLFQTYVAIVSSSVAKADLDVGLSSEEERACAGTMVVKGPCLVLVIE
jgi:hypothetical protein